MAESAGDRNLRIEIGYPAAAFIQNGGRVIDITQPPFNALGDGKTDDTEAFIKAYDYLLERGDAVGWSSAWPDSGSASHIIYIPEGEYLVSNTIIYSGKLRDCHWAPGHAEKVAWIRFIGQSRENTIIRLKDNSPGFEAGANKPVLSYGKFHFNNAVARNSCRNLTILTGKGNPGATGIKFAGANNASMSNVLIKSEDGEGQIGLDLSVGTTIGYYRDLTIEGFDYGIKISPYHFNHPVIEFATLSNQNQAGILVENGGGSLRKIKSYSKAPAVMITDAGAHLVVIDSEFSGKNATGPAISLNNGHLFARNIQVDGYPTSIIKDGHDAGLTQIDEYVSDPVPEFYENQPKKSLNLPIEETPVFEGEPDLSMWANVLDFGAAGDAKTDDTEAIQKAFNSGDPVVYFPRGEYLLTGIIDIPATVKSVEGLYCTFRGGQFRVTGQSNDPLFLNDFTLWNEETPDPKACVLHQSQRTVVLNNVASYALLYKNVAPRGGGKLFANAVNGFKYGHTIHNQKAWIRFANTENRGARKFVFDHATVWLFGFKTESGTLSFWNRDGSKLEILGGVVNQRGKFWEGENTCIINENSDMTLVLYTNGPGASKYYENLIIDKNDGRHLVLTGKDFPERKAGNFDWVIPMYNSY